MKQMPTFPQMPIKMDGLSERVIEYIDKVLPQCHINSDIEMIGRPVSSFVEDGQLEVNALYRQLIDGIPVTTLLGSYAHDDSNQNEVWVRYNHADSTAFNEDITTHSGLSVFRVPNYTPMGDKLCFDMDEETPAEAFLAKVAHLNRFYMEQYEAVNDNLTTAYEMLTSSGIDAKMLDDDREIKVKEKNGSKYFNGKVLVADPFDLPRLRFSLNLSEDTMDQVMNLAIHGKIRYETMIRGGNLALFYRGQVFPALK